MRWRHSAYLCGDHEEAEEPVGEQHLHLLVVGGQVALGGTYTPAGLFLALFGAPQLAGKVI